MTESKCGWHDDDMSVDEDDGLSEETLSQLVTPEGEVPLGHVSCHESVSLQSMDYCDLSMVDNERSGRLVTVPHVTFDPIILRRDVAKMFVLHEYPLSLIDQTGFRDFLRNLNPLFGMVSKETVESDIMKIYKIERCMARIELSEESDMPAGRVSLTTKMWSSSDGSRKFLAITGHVINHEWKNNHLL
ncbi:zinc finger BED domain-containing protein RICESLEEPER 3-like [Spinacia oleracea]|uniref:Zinc finger BED domain-containing protein RICESLEEPER 3-like n=1 Tax=Spinacia oleracea TaxID=3562 RepID=A0ABM3RBL0_SPIOL|nr:zinc finger BED domain-containing protein RICESLEEPER 3-like [Spinacia oleracea]XP_056692995.1 zinc finger BED domain-containing protein RICESLEEPER 3-like [Spinacia oleracea]